MQKNMGLEDPLNARLEHVLGNNALNQGDGCEGEIFKLPPVDFIPPALQGMRLVKAASGADPIYQSGTVTGMVGSRGMMI